MLCPMLLQRNLGQDGSVNKMLAIQICGPGFDSQNPCTVVNMLAYRYNFRATGVDMGGSLLVTRWSRQSSERSFAFIFY